MSAKRSKREKKKEGGESLEKDLEERHEEILRLQAEFENYRKQVDREKEHFMRYANESLMKDLLEVIDSMESAIATDENAEGLKLVYEQFMEILKRNGLERIPAKGGKFDLYYHEVILQENSDQEEGTILEELLPGYKLNNKVIRHSRVKVSTGGDKNG